MAQSASSLRFPNFKDSITCLKHLLSGNILPSSINTETKWRNSASFLKAKQEKMVNEKASQTSARQPSSMNAFVNSLIGTWSSRIKSMILFAIFKASLKSNRATLQQPIPATPWLISSMNLWLTNSSTSKQKQQQQSETQKTHRAPWSPLWQVRCLWSNSTPRSSSSNFTIWCKNKRMKNYSGKWASSCKVFLL